MQPVIDKFSDSDIIGASMSLHRFKFICRLITLDNEETRNACCCIHIVDILYSSNAIQTNQLSMAYCTDVSVILQYLTPTIAYHLLVNQRELKIQLQSIKALEPITIPNISSTSCLYNVTKGSIYPRIATSHQFLLQLGLQRKTSSLQVP